MRRFELRRANWGVVFCAGSVLVLVGAVSCAGGRGTARAADPDQRARVGAPCSAEGGESLGAVRAIVAKYCVSCHSPDGAAGPDYDLSDGRALTARRRNIEAKVRLKLMPPPGYAQLSDADRVVLLGWASGAVGTQCASNASGRDQTER